MRKKLLYLVAMVASFALTANAQCDSLYMVMMDSYGDGWNGNTYAITGSDGTEVATGELIDGSSATDTLCLEDDYYSILVGGGNYAYEVSFSIAGLTDAAVGSHNFWVGEPVWTCDMASSIEGPVSSNTADNNWYTFTLGADGNVAIDLTEDASDFGLTISIYDACGGEKVGEGDLVSGTYYVEVVQTTPEGEVGPTDYTLDVVVTILGCTDPIAENYDMYATVDDASCTYILGCTDDVAQNYNEAATQDDGSCEYILGCIDPTATNYDPTATQDDGSCEYAEICVGQVIANVEVYVGAWGSEMIAQITDTAGVVVFDIANDAEFGANATSYTYDVCLDPANSYELFIQDSYGDGWNSGGYISVSSCADVGAPIYYVEEQGVTTSDDDGLIFVLDAIDCSAEVFGCTNPTADNYNASATVDDGSCVVVGCMSSIYVEYNPDATIDTDPTSCMTLVVEGCTDATASNYDVEANTDDGTCLFCAEGQVPTLIDVPSSSSSWGNGYNVWTLMDVNGVDTLATGSSNESVEACVSPCAVFYPSSIYSWTNYWNDINVSIGDSTFLAEVNVPYIYGDCASHYGCTDPVAENYDATALLDDGSCEFLGSLTCADAIALESDDVYPGVEGEQTWFSFTVDSESLVEISVASTSEFFADVYASCDDTVAMVDAVTYPAGTYYVEVVGGFGSNGADYTISVSSETAVFGCTDPFASNYNQDANVDDELCEYICDGMPVTITSNILEYGYEISWELLDGQGMLVLASEPFNSYTLYTTPELCLTSGETYTFNAYDSYGDGWNSGTYSIEGVCDDSISFVLANNNNQVPDNGENGSDDPELETSETFTVIACTDMIFGCTDETAYNYDANANTNDGSCIPVVYGCTDETAANYNELANVDDGSCLLSCVNVQVTMTTGSWASETSWELLNADDVVLVAGAGESSVDTICVSPTTLTFNAYDSYGDGWNGGTYDVSILCEEPITVANNGGLTPDNGVSGSGDLEASETFMIIECGEIKPGCTDPQAFNYDATTNVDDGSCIPVIFGCMDVTADNFDAAANTPDNSLCEYNCDGAFVDIEMITGSYASETSWTLVNSFGDTIASGAGESSFTSLCLPEGFYAFNAYDSYGDGWNGGTYSVSTFCSETIIFANNGGETPNNGTSGSNDTESIENFEIVSCANMIFGCVDTEAFNYDETANTNDGSCIPFIEGCTDVNAANYNENANTEDGSCLAECEDVVFDLIGGSDDWSSLNTQASWDVMSSDSTVVLSGGVTEYGILSTSDTICLEAGTYTFNAYYSSTWSTSWYDDAYTISLVCDTTVSVITSSIGAEVNHGDSESFTVLACSDVVFGCMDVTALNYDVEANMPAECEYIYGCMNMDATNYDELATASNDSCEFGVPMVLTPETGTMIDLSNPDTLTFTWEALYDGQEPVTNYYVLMSSNADDLGSSPQTSPYDQYGGSVVYNVGATGWGNTETTISVPYVDLYNWFIENGYGLNDQVSLHWWVTNDYIYDGWSDEGGFSQYTYIDTVFAGSNEIILTYTGILGCTDATAYNYNEEATIDDGSCILPCTAEEISVDLNMEAGSWASEASWMIFAADSTEVMSGGLPFVTEYPACLAPGDYYIEAWDSYGDGWNGGTYEISVSCGDASIVLANNGGVTPNDGASGGPALEASESFSVVACSEMAIGCMDSIALNFDPLAEFEGPCDYIYGCMDEAYLEYNPEATMDTDPTSCITLNCTGIVLPIVVDGGSYQSEVSWSILSGDEVIISGGAPFSEDVCFQNDICYTIQMGDSYGDTWNGNTLEIGSAIFDGPESGCDYNGNWSNPDECWAYDYFSLNAACGVPGCTDPTALNYDENATMDDGSCIETIVGCMDPTASNFDPLANVPGLCVWECYGDQVPVAIQVTTDQWADNENEYTLTADGLVIGSVDLASNTTTTDHYCVDPGAELVFTMTDSFGDGFLASSEGGYTMWVCDEIVAEDYAWTGLNIADAVATATACGAEVIEPCAGMEATLTISTAIWAGDVQWSLEDANGNQVAGLSENYENESEYVMDLCLDADADYQFNMADAGADGWNGTTFSIDAACGNIAAGTLESGEAGFVAFNASCASTGECMVPASWDVTVTGANHTVMIPATALISVDDVATTDVAVGVFFTNTNGDLQCAGYTYITGETVQIAAMGDDTTTGEVDGLTSGAELMWMIYDCASGESLSAVTTYTNGPSAYTANGLTFVESISTVPAGPTCQTIDIPAGWSMFSTYMIAADMDLANILDPIVDNVIIAKNNAGSAYLVEWGFNGVGNMVVGQGYQIKTDAAVSLEICGEYAFPEENPINLTAGWNMIGYLRLEGADAIAVLADVNDADNLIIAKDYNGAAYLPEWGFNGIGDMQPGQGYQLKTITEDVLQYLSNDASYRNSSVEVTENNLSNYAKVAATDNNMTVVIEDAAWDVVPTEGAEVAAFDKEGNMIGAAVYTSPVTVLTVWGDDAMTASKDGLATSEVASFKVWSNGSTASFEVTEWVEGSSVYQVDAINVAGAITTAVEVVDANATERVLVKVINVLGQEVVNVDAELFEGKVLFNVYNDGSVEKVVK